MANLKCSSCGTLVTTEDRYCQNCGENNPKFIEVKTTTSSSSTSYSSNNSYSSATTVQENSGIGWLFFGLFFPIIATILFFVFRNDKPNAAGMNLTGAAIRLFITLLVFAG
jgi:uncharacterized OB-fold protein